MLKEELFKELTANNIEFNGDIDLTDVGLVWSLKLEDFEELIEALEEDLEFVENLLVFYEEDVNQIELGELLFDDGLLFVELITEDLDSELE